MCEDNCLQKPSKNCFQDEFTKRIEAIIAVCVNEFIILSQSEPYVLQVNS